MSQLYLSSSPHVHSGDTTTKVMRFAPQGLQQLKQWIGMVGDRYPVVAIGGIDLGNTPEVLKTGVGSVAMVRAVTEAPDYKQAIADFQQLLDCALVQPS